MLDLLLFFVQSRSPSRKLVKEEKLVRVMGLTRRQGESFASV